jgi:hypothetical protein
MVVTFNFNNRYKALLSSVIFLILGWSVNAIAAEDVVSDDGREVRLNEDGTWSLLSRDRFATTPDGRRIRLMTDGRWELIIDPEAAISNTARPMSVASPHNHMSSNATRILLTQVDILKVNTTKHKAITADTRTFYYLTVTNNSDQAIELTQSKRKSISATDSKGRKYDVEALRFDNDVIASGESQQLIVIIDGAPLWYNVRYLSIELAANTFGQHPRVVLSKNMPDIETKVVEAF